MVFDPMPEVDHERERRLAGSIDLAACVAFANRVWPTRPGRDANNIEQLSSRPGRQMD